MADAAISFAVEKLGNLLIQKVDFLLGVEEKVKWLKTELQRMQCFLKDASEKQASNQSIRQWISDIREVAHDAEDAIEIFILKVENPRSDWELLRRCVCFLCNTHHLDRVGEEIESIRARLEDIEKSRVRYGIQDLGTGMDLPTRRSEEDAVQWRRRLPPWQKEKHVVGLEEDVELLLNKAILERRESLSIVTIVGLGGIGKTTLARKLYNHNAVASKFERRAWVCVSNDFRPREIMKDLMLQLLEPTEDELKVLEIVEKSPLSYLQRKIYERLQGKQYFIVIDDVWEGEHWEFLAAAFPNEDKESRLLLTSRSRDIASCARSVHDMKVLNSDQSWELFLNKSFIDNIDGKCPEELESIGREILRKCSGLPLAIIVIGGLLVKQRQTRSGWEKVLKEMNSRFGETGSTVVATLELSYQHLPSQLKSCFLCLSFFKEDAIIDVEKLTQVWVAQGLIPERGGDESFEDIATSYLDELINRNLVQVKFMCVDGRVKTCVVHDLLRELAIEKAKEEMSLEIMREEGNSQSSNKPRHRIIHCSTGERVMRDSENRNKHVRSLFFYGSGGKIASGPSYWKSYELLRTLSFSRLKLRIELDAIGALIGLRYLGLRFCGIRKLPSSFGRLVNLEVLDILHIHPVEVPNVLWKMISLRHLYMDAIRCKGPLKIDTLKNLRTLNRISMADIEVEHLSQLTSLCELDIWVDTKSDVRKLCGSLAMLENLVSLYLKKSFDGLPLLEDRLGTLQHITQLILVGRLPNLPSPCNFPKNLSFLNLMFTRLSEDPMLVLEKLPKLLGLQLSYNACSGEDMMISRDGFPRLKFLSLSDMNNLRSINVEEGAMPELKQLQIKECLNLGSDMLTQVVKSISSNLQALKVVTTQDIALKLRDEGADVISNIPSVDIIGRCYN